MTKRLFADVAASWQDCSQQHPRLKLDGDLTTTNSSKRALTANPRRVGVYRKSQEKAKTTAGKEQVEHGKKVAWQLANFQQLLKVPDNEQLKKGEVRWEGRESARSPPANRLFGFASRHTSADIIQGLAGTSEVPPATVCAHGV